MALDREIELSSYEEGRRFFVSSLPHVIYAPRIILRVANYGCTGLNIRAVCGGDNGLESVFFNLFIYLKMGITLRGVTQTVILCSTGVVCSALIFIYFFSHLEKERKLQNKCCGITDIQIGASASLFYACAAAKQTVGVAPLPRAVNNSECWAGLSKFCDSTFVLRRPRVQGKLRDV